MNAICAIRICRPFLSVVQFFTCHLLPNSPFVDTFVLYSLDTPPSLYIYIHIYINYIIGVIF